MLNIAFGNKRDVYHVQLSMKLPYYQPSTIFVENIIAAKTPKVLIKNQDCSRQDPKIYPDALRTSKYGTSP